MSTAPFEAYAEWFEALPPDLANELAAALMQTFPGDLLTPTLATPNPTDGLLPRMRRLAATPAKEIGLVATLKVLTQLAFQERTASEHTSRTAAMLDVLDTAQDSLTGDGSSMDEAVAEWIANQQLRQPLRTRQWEKEVEGWRALEDGPLAADRLLDYLRSRTLGL